MTMLTTFAPPARQAVIRAGLLASEGGMSRLSDGYLLLALAESQPLTRPVDLGVTVITLNEGGRKVIEVARWVSRRGHRTQVTREDLLWGLLADASSESVGILRHCRVDIGRLWADLRRWYQSA